MLYFAQCAEPLCTAGMHSYNRRLTSEVVCGTVVEARDALRRHFFIWICTEESCFQFGTTFNSAVFHPAKTVVKFSTLFWAAAVSPFHFSCASWESWLELCLVEQLNSKKLEETVSPV